MTSVANDHLEDLIRACGEGWLIDQFDPPEKALPHFHAILLGADVESRKRFGAGGPRFTPSALEDEHKRNPYKVRGFLQALGSVETPAMLVLIWRILQGLQIASISMVYDADRMKNDPTGAFQLSIRLFAPDAASYPEDYTSTRVYDVAILRHLGIIEHEGRGVIDGFVALRTGK
jgi:hypothetical protein